MRLELPPERRGRAFGGFGALMGFAAAVGPILGGVLVDAFGWEAVFVVNVPVLALSVVVASRPLTSPSPSATRFDWWGSVLLTLALVLLVVGAQEQHSRSLAVLAAGLAVLGLFGWWERRAEDPVVDVALFRSRPFAAGTAVIALQNLVMYALLFHLPLVLDELFALGAQGTGQLLTFLTGGDGRGVAARRTAHRPRGSSSGGSVRLTALPHGTGAVGPLRAVRPGRPAHPAGSARRRCRALLPGRPDRLAVERRAVAERDGIRRRIDDALPGRGCRIALLGRGLDLHGSRADVLTEHRALLAVYAVTLLASLACAAVLPRKQAMAQVGGGPGR
jgi:hypothetical protein